MPHTLLPVENCLHSNPNGECLLMPASNGGTNIMITISGITSSFPLSDRCFSFLNAYFQYNGFKTGNLSMVAKNPSLLAWIKRQRNINTVLGLPTP